MTEDKSYVDYLIKKGVSGGAGFELRVKLCKGDSKDELIQLGKDAIEVAGKLMNESVR